MGHHALASSTRPAHDRGWRARAASCLTVAVTLTAGTTARAQDDQIPPTEVTTLIAQLADEERGRAAQVALLRIGEAAARPLGEAIATGWRNDPRGPRARAAAARVLKELGPGSAPACSALYGAALDHSAPTDVPQHAGSLLGLAAPFAGAAADSLRKTLNAHSGPHRRIFARTALSGLSVCHPLLVVDGASASFDELITELGSEAQPYATATACRALAWRQAEWSEAQRAQIVASLRAVVERSFERGELRAIALPTVTRSVRMSVDIVEWLRTTASQALTRFAPNDPAAMLGHCQRLFELDPDVQIDAARRLGAIGRIDAARWLLDLANWSDGDPRARCAALAGLERMGPRAAVYGVRLHPLTESKEPSVAAMATRVLRSVAPRSNAHSAGDPDFFVCCSGPALVDGLDWTGESRRLRAWLDTDNGARRLRLHVDPAAIDAFHALPTDEGGPLSTNCRWIPVRVGPDRLRPGFWEAGYRDSVHHVVAGAPANTVGARGERLADLPWHVELILTDRSTTTVRTGDIARLRRDDSPLPTYRLQVADPMRGPFDEVRQSLLEEGGAVLTVVDGLATWVLPVEARRRPSPAMPHVFAVDQPALDRVPRLDRLLR